MNRIVGGGVKLKAIIVDDEQLALDFIERKLENINAIKIVEKYLEVDIHQLDSILKDVDIAFLDVEMPRINGLELAELILSIDPSIHIVFVTAFSEYAVQAFELNAIDYIIKPVDENRLEQTIDRIKLVNRKQQDELTPSDKILHIQLCNEFSIVIDNQKRDYIKWRTAKAKEVFLYLLHHRGEKVRKSTLVDLIWEDFDADRAYPQLYTTVYHIRNALKVFENHFSIHSVMDGYILHTSNIHIDIEKWKEEIASLGPISDETIKSYENVMHLYKGGYLVNENYLWVASEQYRLETLWIETAHHIAEFYDDNNDLDNAEKWYRRITEQFPEDELAQFNLMKIYYEYNYHLLIDQQYNQLKATLEELDTPMNPEIKAWYKKVRN